MSNPNGSGEQPPEVILGPPTEPIYNPENPPDIIVPGPGPVDNGLPVTGGDVVLPLGAAVLCVAVGIKFLRMRKRGRAQPRPSDG